MEKYMLECKLRNTLIFLSNNCANCLKLCEMQVNVFWGKKVNRRFGHYICHLYISVIQYSFHQRAY